MNELVLMDWLRIIALVAPHDELTSTVCSLEACDEVRLGQYDDNRVLERTERSQVVALGRAIAEGVLRPGPDCPY